MTTPTPPDAVAVVVDHFAKGTFWGGAAVTAAAVAALIAGSISAQVFAICAVSSALAATWGVLARAVHASRVREAEFLRQIEVLKQRQLLLGLDEAPRALLWGKETN